MVAPFNPNETCSPLQHVGMQPCPPFPLLRPHAHPPLPHPHEEVLQTEDTEEDTHEGSGYTGEDRPVLVLAPDWVCAI